MALLDDAEKLGAEIVAGKTPTAKRTKWDDLEDQGNAVLTATPPVVAPPSVVAPPRWTEDNPTFAMGDPREALPPSTTDVRRIGGAMAEGWRAAPSILTPEAQEGQRRLWGALVGGSINTIYDWANAIPAAGNALLYGGAEIANQVTGDPRAGRDVMALSQVAPMAHIGTGVPRVAEPPNPLSRPAFVSERTSSPRAAGVTDAERIAQLLRHDDAETMPGGPPPAPETPSAAPPPTGGPATLPSRAAVTAPPIEGPAMLNAESEAAAPGPRSGGAAATTAPIPNQTKTEIATNIRKDVGQTAVERAGGDKLRDDNVYVEGIPPRPEAYRDFNPQTALDHKYFYGHGGDTTYRTAIDAINRERHDGMTSIVRTDMGDANTLKALEDHRREVTPEKMGVFVDEKPVDPRVVEGYRARLKDLIDGPYSKRKGVRGILQDVYDSMADKDGNIETLPSRLQGVRDNMTDWLAKHKGSTEVAKDVGAARNVLTSMVEELNPIMTSGAPKWDLWRQEWASRSRLIDQQEFLQDYDVGRSKSLWDAKGNLQFRKVQQLLADVANNYDKPNHPAQSITDAQIQNFVAVRNELGAEHLADLQGKTPGSPTMQLRERAAKEGGTSMAKMAATGAAHVAGLGAAAMGVPGVNAAIGLYQTTKPLRDARKAGKTAAALADESNALKQRLLSQPPVNPLNPY